MTQYQKRKIPFGEAMYGELDIKPGKKFGETVYLEDEFPNLSPEAEEYMEGVIGEHNYRQEIQSRASSQMLVNNASGRKESAQIGRNKADNKMMSRAAVRESVMQIIEEDIERGKKPPKGIHPEFDAKIEKAEQQKFAKSQERLDDVRKGEIRNAEIERRIEEYRSATDKPRPEAVSDLRNFEKRIEEYRQETGVSKAEAVSHLQSQGDSNKPGGIPYKGQCKETWYQEEILGEEMTHENKGQEKAQQPVMEMA